jgi:alpha-N-acetylglucosaminidase
MKRWQVYFAALDDELRTGVAAKPIDWFALGEEWNRGKQRYPTLPQGDTYELAAETAKVLGLLD